MAKIHRIERIEDAIGRPDDRVKEIVVEFINPDGTIASTMTKKLRPKNLGLNSPFGMLLTR